MPGIYVHIPFCKQKCSYCDFHFSTNKRQESEMVGTICEEIIHKSEEVINNDVGTIYFGGGSPSFVDNQSIAKILEQIRTSFNVDRNAEVTIECNPDDINTDFLEFLRDSGFNRISLGVQSFYDDDLQILNRAHNSGMAKDSILLMKEYGFDNITLDLIYGLPNSDLKRWKKNIDQALDLGIPHISSYCLTVEDKTLLKHQLEKGELKLPEPEIQLNQFELLVQKLTKNGYDHYEISNFCLPGYESKHNSSYWKGTDYLGLGPSAHSKIANKRYWNIANNNQYIKRFKTDKSHFEEEILTPKDEFNELLMIGLRTKWGVNLDQIKQSEFYNSEFENELNRKIKEGKIVQENDIIFIPGKNKFIADTIISDLFIV